ncbi:TPA: cyclic nucleotide-binding/CBS domain-containing protein [Pseudomonas aeruginosa]|nr:cyclic nucleotide-binding/CBS domain-containing protein [Pseudomonas aeruginosa]
MPDSFNFASPPFDQLRPHQRETLKQALSVGYYAPGETLLEAGSAVPGLFVLLKGVVEERGDDGRVFAQYAADDLFDVRGLFSGSSKHRYLAIEESIVYELPASCFHQLCGENPDFARFFQADLAAKRQLAQRDGQNLAEFILTRIAREHLLPALEVEASLSLGYAARLQLSHGADALLVRLERDGPELGIVTRTDLMSAHFRDGRSELEAIGPLAHGPLASVELGDFLFDAMILMTRQRIERVAVTEDGQVIGLLHLTQVLSLFSTHSHVLALRIARADGLGDLRRCAETLDTLIATLAGNGIRLRFIMQLVSALNEQLLERLFELLLPPTLRGRCCLLVMGSEGRGEQLLKTDQDNALVLADDLPQEQALAMMQRFSAALLEFGYPPCPGGVMASRPEWCKPLAAWQAELRGTLLEGKPEQLLRLSILADAWPVAGNLQLFEPLRRQLRGFADGGERWLADIAAAALQFDTPLTFLGQLKTQDARLDLKRGGIFPIVHGIRTLALREGLETRGTLARIEALKRHKVLEARLADDLSESFELFLQLRLTRQLAGQRDGRQQGLDVSGMSRHDRDMLRYGLHVVKKFKQSVARQFHLETR